MPDFALTHGRARFLVGVPWSAVLCIPATYRNLGGKTFVGFGLIPPMLTSKKIFLA